MALMQLIRPPGRIEGGRVELDELELLSLAEEEMRSVRFSRISLIPQGVMNSLNPVMRVGAQIADTIEAHEERPDREALQERVRRLLALVELDPATARMYPHELSGGMKQRVGMAIAVALRPQVIIADEPTSALDVVVQKRVMDTLFRVQQELDAAVILVGHDMGLMAQCVDRIGVMYAGRLAELGAGAESARRAAASVHAHVGRKPAVAGAQGRVSRHSWTAAFAAGAAARVSLPSALSAGDGSLLGSRAGVGRGGC